MRAHSSSNRRAKKVICEALENRRLMSLTIEVRNPDGSASAAVSTGQVLNLDVLAVITSSNNQPTQDGLEDVAGSFIAAGYGPTVSNVFTAPDPVAGNLSVTNLAPFKADGASTGKLQDLNGDGNLDVGSTDPFNTTNYFFARSSPLQTAGAGTIVGNTLVFKIATLTYTVTNGNFGGETDINFVPYQSFTADGASWEENGSQKDNLSGTFQAGSAYRVTDPALISPPIIQTINDVVPDNTPSVIYELRFAEVEEPIDLSSVHILSGPSHGTAQPQSDGTILYTPTSGYDGADAFTFTDADVDGHVTPVPTTVKLNVVPRAAPVANDFSAATFANQTVTINALPYAGPVINSSEFFVVNGPAHGTATPENGGLFIYKPDVNFVGTDTFTYTADDIAPETSNVATITVTVTQPTPPVAGNDAFNADPGVPTTLNLQTNDTASSLALADEVEIETQPSHGTVTVGSSGSVVYTAAPDYVGTDSFTYIDTDTLGDPSNPATVTLTIADIPPTAGAFTAPVFTGQTSSIDVLSQATSGGTSLVPASVKVVTAAADGNAVVNSDGSISYTPSAGFVGSDSFTYTVADIAGGVSAPATVSVDVGAIISNAKGDIHSLVFKDAAGGAETISLNRGTADAFFTGNGSITVAKNGKATLASTGVDLSSIALSGTTRASTLSINGKAGTPISIGGISDPVPLGSFTAASANVTGTINLNGATSLTLGNISNATITIGNSVPAKFALTSGAVSNTSLTSGVPITSIRSTSWTGNQNISAPAITSITTKTGDLAANITTGAIGAISVGGGLSDTIDASSIKSIKVTGDITGAAINIKGSSKASLGTLTAASMSSVSVYVNVQSLIAPIAPIEETQGSIGSIQLTGKGDFQYTNSFIIATKIGSVSLGKIHTDNSAYPDGIRGDSFGVSGNINSFRGTFSTVAIHLNAKQLEGDFFALLTKAGGDAGDFVL